VVEVEHMGVAFAAVHTRMPGEMAGHERTRGRDPLASRRGALAPVDVAALSEIGPEALSAPVLVGRTKAVEGLERERPLAPPASLDELLDHEHMFARDADGPPGLSWPGEPGGRGHLRSGPAAAADAGGG